MQAFWLIFSCTLRTASITDLSGILSPWLPNGERIGCPEWPLLPRLLVLFFVLYKARISLPFAKAVLWMMMVINSKLNLITFEVDTFAWSPPWLRGLTGFRCIEFVESWSWLSLEHVARRSQKWWSYFLLFGFLLISRVPLSSGVQFCDWRRLKIQRNSDRDYLISLF